jgi:hypothetical protein
MGDCKFGLPTTGFIMALWPDFCSRIGSFPIFVRIITCTHESSIIQGGNGLLLPAVSENLPNDCATVANGSGMK